MQIFNAIPSSIVSLNLGGNKFQSKSSTDLVQIFSAIPSNVAYLNLKINGFGKKTGNELAVAFAAIPSTVKSLNLSGEFEGLHNLPTEEIELLKNTLPEITTIYLSLESIKQMTPAQRVALKNIFPKCQNTILLNYKGKAVGDNEPQINLFWAKKYALTNRIPSLKSSAAFFVKSQKKNEIDKLPQELQDFVNRF